MIALALLFGVLAGSVGTFVWICWLAYRSGIGPPDAPAQTPLEELTPEQEAWAREQAAKLTAMSLAQEKERDNALALEAAELARDSWEKCRSAWWGAYNLARDDGILLEEAYACGREAARTVMEMLPRGEVENLRDALETGALRLTGPDAENAHNCAAWFQAAATKELELRDEFNKPLLEAADLVTRTWKLAVEHAAEAGADVDGIAEMAWYAVREMLRQMDEETELMALSSAITTKYLAFNPEPVDNFTDKLASAVATELNLRDATMGTL